MFFDFQVTTLNLEIVRALAKGINCYMYSSSLSLLCICLYTGASFLRPFWTYFMPQSVVKSWSSWHIVMNRLTVWDFIGVPCFLYSLIFCSMCVLLTCCVCIFLQRVFPLLECLHFHVAGQLVKEMLVSHPKDNCQFIAYFSWYVWFLTWKS